MGQTKALATDGIHEDGIVAQVQNAVDPEIIALASAFFTAGEMTRAAIKAADLFYLNRPGC